MKNEETAYAIPVSCRDCRMSTMCIPLSLRSDELYKLDQVIQRGSPYQTKGSIFYCGDKFTSAYAVRSGSVKSYCIDNEGREQVTGFYPARRDIWLGWSCRQTIIKIPLLLWKPPQSAKYPTDS